MTPAEVRQLADEQVMTDLVTACSVLGMSLTTGRALEARGAFPVEVCRWGRVLRVRTNDLARLVLGES